MIMYREMSWWYWAITTLLLFVGLAGLSEAFFVAAVLSLIQVVHFRLREKRYTAFPVQVRITYSGLLMLGLCSPRHGLLWILAIGTAVQVLFGYCTLARTLSLMSWNRHEPLTWELVWRTFSARPVKGNIMQGLPAKLNKAGV